MFRQISWFTYLEFIAAVLVIYYTVVFIVYYKCQVAKLHWVNLFGQNTTTTSTKMKTEAEAINNLMEEIQQCIYKANKNRSPKEEILFAIHGLINDKRFQAIKQPYKNIINDFVSETFENIYSIHLDEEELIVLWT
jgi:hypothetical protein